MHSAGASVRKKPAHFTVDIVDEPVNAETAAGTKLAPEGANLTMPFSKNDWGVILGGSSGFGRATAHEVSAHCMSLCIVHRDRWGAMARIEPEFHKIRGRGPALLVFDADVLDREGRASIVTELSEVIGSHGRVGVLLHSIAFGNSKVTPERCVTSSELAALATELAMEEH
jgi:short-subunit dehydrogenase